jgi:hypothetical protein
VVEKRTEKHKTLFKYGEEINNYKQKGPFYIVEVCEDFASHWCCDFVRLAGFMRVITRLPYAYLLSEVQQGG